ncbi:MAG: nitrate reductase [Gammaproteobacteria bacterium]|nr:nitrate reductase [Gammaproteobacteria bacterium]
MNGASLLDFARGPAFEAAVAMLSFGIVWRLTGILALRRSVDHSRPRTGFGWMGGLRMIVSRSWPRREFRERVLHWDIISYLFHIGYAVAILGYVPHILLIRNLVGLQWPGLPGGVIAFAAGISAAALLALLGHRMTSPVLRQLSNFDDYFSWFVAFVPLVTGLMAYYNIGDSYQLVLGLHILSGDILFAWLPFGKIMHVILFAFSRGTTGTVYGRRGAAT